MNFWTFNNISMDLKSINTVKKNIWSLNVFKGSSQYCFLKKLEMYLNWKATENATVDGVL